MGPLYLQDVSCTGGEVSYTDCNASLVTDAFCMNTSNAVGVRCYFENSLSGSGFGPTETPTGVASGSGNGSAVCTEGDLIAEQSMTGLTLLSANGSLLSNTSLLLTACVLGSIGGVCQRGFEDQDADVACRDLGYNYGGEVAIDQSNNYTGPIYVQDVNCTGEETHPSQCAVNIIELTPDCFSSSSIVRINCFRDTSFPCDDTGYLYPVQTAPSTSFSLLPGGRVESFYTTQLAYCVNGTNYGICQSNFDDSAALVACRSFMQFIPGLNITRAEAIYNGYSDNMGPLYLQDVSCTGNEVSYTDCNASLVTDAFCMNTSNAVGVRCYFENSFSGSGFGTTETPTGVASGSGNGSAVCTDGDLIAEQSMMGLTLLSANGSLLSSTSLLLTACVLGSFGGICQRGFEDQDADVACRFLGYNYGGEVAMNQSNNYAGPIYIQDVSCTGEETHPSQCAVNTDLTPDCFSSSSIVRINCFNDTSFPCDDTGYLYPVQTAPSTSFSLLPGGRLESFYTTQLAYCVNGTNYGICQSNFYDSAALVACRSFMQFIPGLTITRAEAIYNGYSDNMGPLYLQDVSCTGNEVSYIDCNASLVTDTFCMNTSNAVGVQCYFETDITGSGNDTGSGIDIPDQVVFPFGPDVGDQRVPDNSFGVELPFPSPFSFSGRNYSSIFINIYGTVSFGDSYNMSTPQDFPFVSPPLIAPFWINFDYRAGGSIYYREIASPPIIDRINAAVDAYNGFQRSFSSEYSILVTWDNVPIAGSTENSSIFQCVITNDGYETYVWLAYSNNTFPSGASIGINSGDGVSFVQLASVSLGNSSRIAFGTDVNVLNVPGLYLYRLDTFGLTTPTAQPSPTPICSEGDVFIFNVNTVSQNEITGAPVVCRDGNIGGICRDGFDDEDALVVCRTLVLRSFENATVTGGFVSETNYSFPLIVQDVNCTGSETTFDECSSSNITTTDCSDPSNIAGIRCIVDAPPVCTDGDLLILDYIQNDFQQTMSEIRLNFSAQLGLCANGFFGTYCRNGLNYSEVAVACQTISDQLQLPYPDPTFLGGQVVQSQNNMFPITVQNVMCNGNERSLTQCSQTTMIDSACSDPSSAAEFICYVSFPIGPGSGSGSGAVGDNQALLAPFGTPYGDSTLLGRSPFGYSDAIFLSPAFPYFGQNMTELYINSNGFISFMRQCVSSVCFNARPLPFQSPPIIAALWADYTLESIGFGEVFYRLDRDPILLRNISDYIQNQRSEFFMPSYAIVATWFELPYRFSMDPTVTNTFQAILATDGLRSYVGLSYGRLEIDTLTYAGFNFGDDLSFVDINTFGIAAGTNVPNDESLGRYLYRINDLPLTSCQTGQIRETFLQTTRSGEEIVVVSLIEACVRGVYGGICDRNISPTTVQVICNSLGYGEASRSQLATDFSYTYNGQIVLQSIDCTGNEPSLELCNQTSSPSAECINTARATRVRCYYSGNITGSGSGIGPVIPFLAFGEQANDITLPSGCNLYSLPISLSPPFVYFGQSQSTLYINSNGYFTFGEIFTSCCNVYFPTVSPPLIAALWRGYNTSRLGGNGGNVTYRFTTDQETLDYVSNLISDSSGQSYVASYVVVATWYMVLTDNPMDSSRYSFQAILTSNGRYSFVIFIYGNLDGIRGVQVGFNLGDGYTYGSDTLTNTYLYSSVDIHLNSNTGIPGTYIFRVDNFNSSFGPTLFPTFITPTSTSAPVYSCFDGEVRILTINSSMVTASNLDMFTRSYVVPLVCINGTLTYVCDSGWGIQEATTVCRSVHSFFSSEPLYGVMVNSSLPPVRYGLQDLNCTEFSYNINNDCASRPADNSVCGVNGMSSIAGAVCQEMPYPCNHGDIRLNNQTYNYSTGYQNVSGRVEFCQNGTYTAVCNETFSQTAARTVCRTFGRYYDSATFEISNWAGDTLSGLECSTTNFFDCQVPQTTCQDPTTVAGVRCTEVLTDCFTDGDVRYTNINTVTNSSGTFITARPEVCYNGTYGSICNKYINDSQAEFVCRDRFSASVGTVISSPNLATSPPIVLERLDFCSTAYSCGGSNFNVLDPDCTNSSQALGISCSRTCREGDTRIVGTDRYYEGVVEICRNNEWGVICDQGWNDISAAVLCQEQGFGAGGSVATFGWSSNRPIVTSNVTCDLRYNDALSNCLNCTILPSGCSSQTIAGVRCQPGSLSLNIVSIPSGIASYNSSLSLQCNGYQSPFNSTLISYQWTDSDGPISNSTRRSTRIVPSGLDGYYYQTFFFNTSLDFQALRVQDAGIYNCSMSINVTYPDGPNNSSATITNTTYYALWIRVPTPYVAIQVSSPPYAVNEPFQASCIVNTVEGISIGDVNIAWYDGSVLITSSFDSRINVGETEAINATWFSRSISVSRLMGTDAGNYTCRSSISGFYFFSGEATATASLVVEGIPENASAPLVNVISLNEQVLLEGGSAIITFAIEAYPAVVTNDIRWFYVMPGSNRSVEITGTSMLGNRTMLEFSSDRLSLTLSDLTVQSSGLYFITASNLAGSGTNITYITVQTIPQVMFDPLQPFILNTISDTFTLAGTCSAWGYPVPNITWSATNGTNFTILLSQEFQGINISTTVRDNTVTSVINLMDTNISARGGTITCTASNAVTNVSSSQMPYIAVTAQPEISGVGFNVTEGDNFTLTCNSNYSIPAPVFKWTRNGVQIRNTSTVTIQSRSNIGTDGLYTYTSDLTLTGAQLSDGGDYICSTNQDDSRLSTPLTSSSNAFSVSVNRFDDCEAAGFPCQNNGTCIDGDGTYFCRCVGPFDGRNCTISATTKAPSIISGPTGGAFGIRSTTTLSCIVDGIPTPEISWFLNGQLTSLPAVPNVTITVTPENRGSYDCRAQNDLGAVDSEPAFISINNIQQYNVALGLSSRRRRQTSSEQTLREIVINTVGLPVGNMGIEVDSADVVQVSNDGRSATALYTLRRPEGVEFSGGVTSALSSTISSSSTAIVVSAIARFDGCSEESVGGYRWPESSLLPEVQVLLPCQCNSTSRDDILPGSATRVCGGSFTTGAMWLLPNTSSCVFDSFVQQICSASSEEVFGAIASGVGSSQSVNLSLSIVAEALSAPASLQTLDGVADAINALLMANMDSSFANELRSNGVTFVNNILVDIEALGYAIGDVSNEEIIKKTLLKVRYQRISSNRLTSSDTYTVEAGSPLVIFNSEVAAMFSGDVSLALANIDSSSIGRGSRTSGTFSDMLFSVSIGNAQVSRLSDDITILFPVISQLDNPTACVFWDPQLNSGYGDWSDVGCRVDKTDDGEARCRCNHLSTFGVIYGNPLPSVPPTPVVTEVFEISVIIYVCLIISILLLLVIVIIYLSAGKLRKQAQIVFVNTSLIGLYIAYIISTVARQLSEHNSDGQSVCGLFAAILEYFQLTFFLWTMSEAIILVLMARNNFKIPKYYFLVSVLVCYLLPLVIVGISLGGYQYFLRDSFCIPTNWPFYFGFVAAFVVFIVFNVIFYLTAAHTLWSDQSMKHDFKVYLMHYIIIATILFVVFVFLWIFGLIGTSNRLSRNSYVAGQYIFSILALVHSILTVSLHIIRSKEAKRIVTCQSAKRSYDTAGSKPPPAEGTELTQSYTAPSTRPDREEAQPISYKKKAVENVYSPPGAAGQDMVAADDEQVKTNLSAEDDDDDKTVTSL